MGRAGRRTLALVVVALLPAGARAEEPRDAPEPQPEAHRREWAVVPFVGGDTDIGFGAGAIGSVALLDPAFHPFRWRLESFAFVTFRNRDGLDSPYQDIYMQLTVNGLLSGRGRLELRPSYTREINLRYFGIGNAATAGVDEPAQRSFFTRVHPALVARFRLALRPPFHLQLGTLYTQSWIDYAPDSTLARDLAAGPPRARELLEVDRRHGLHLMEAGLVMDTRDNEVSPGRGQYHTLKVRGSPWSTSALPYRYVQLDATARAYATVWPRRLILAARLVGDLQIGDVPFYELSRYDEASALGGANGVRGIPGDRYRGKRKLFGNLEARTRLASFELGNSRYALGAAGFADGGRVWADVTSAPELDGTGLGLKYGVGGGLRVHKGDSFVLRMDLAWSPDARPLAGYFLAGEIF